MSGPLVSIVIGAYNAEPWLAETLASAAGQTYPNIETVLVDDGSTDETLAIARRFEGPTVQVIHQDNAGACAARNRALAEAQGDVIQFLDADDLLDARKIEVQMDRLRREPPRTLATATWARFRDALPEPPLPTFADFRDYDPATDWLIQAGNGEGTIPSFSWLVPRDVVEDAGPWNETLRINQDGEYFARVVTQSDRIAFCPEAVGYYRSGLAGSVSQRRDPDALASFFESIELCEAALLRVRDTPEARQACASLWQTFLFRAYPYAPDLVARAEARIRELGGGLRQPSGGRAFKLLRDTLGWKAAIRMQRAWYRVRHAR